MLTVLILIMVRSPSRIKTSHKTTAWMLQLLSASSQWIDDHVVYTQTHTHTDTLTDTHIHTYRYSYSQTHTKTNTYRHTYTHIPTDKHTQILIQTNR